MLQLLDFDDMRTFHLVTEPLILNKVYFGYSQCYNCLTNRGIVSEPFLYNGMLFQKDARVKFANGFLGIMMEY